jgi:DNA (cytosine-5)-methyltransferase 1
MKNQKLTYIDLFSGCGGLSEGFTMSRKFEGLAHVEWEVPMVETLRNRLNKKWKHSKEDSFKKVIHFDIQKTDELINGNWSEQSVKEFGNTNDIHLVKSGLKGIIGKQKVDLIIGGPPCQAYSIAGRAQDKNSMKNDYRNYLFESFVKVVDSFKPEVFVFENVPGILSACPGDIPVTKRIFDAFAKIGYIVRTPENQKDSVFTASDFGVPQKRNRVIIIGVKKDSKVDLEVFYKAIKFNIENIEVKTVRDTIFNLPKILPLKKQIKESNKNISHKFESNGIKHHEPRFHNDRDVLIFKRWITTKMNDKGLDEKIRFYNDLLGKNSKHAKYRNLEWDKPSPTIVAHLYKDGLMFIHPDKDQARSITVKEAALLQSFPNDYDFIGRQSDCYKMIGNAVPPEMAKHIANSIYDVLNNKFKPRIKPLNIIIACEESQAITKQLRKLGHNAFSCDLLKCSGGRPDLHFNMDIFKVIKNKGGILQNGDSVIIPNNWDMMIAHPPCTFLASSGAQWYYNPKNKSEPHPKFPLRAIHREEAVTFFKKLWEVNIDKIVIENPIGIMSSRLKPPTQIVQPYMFGDEATKTTCLWIKGLPKLVATNIVGKGERKIFASGKSMPLWYSDALNIAKTPQERQTLRSKTFKGMAEAMALQWAGKVNSK